jgi:hypothetical protein
LAEKRERVPTDVAWRRYYVNVFMPLAEALTLSGPRRVNPK